MMKQLTYFAFSLATLVGLAHHASAADIRVIHGINGKDLGLAPTEIGPRPSGPYRINCRRSLDTSSCHTARQESGPTARILDTAPTTGSHRLP